MRTFFQLTEEDLDFVLEEKRIGLTIEESETTTSIDVTTTTLEETTTPVTTTTSNEEIPKTGETDSFQWTVTGTVLLLLAGALVVWKKRLKAK